MSSLPLDAFDSKEHKNFNMQKGDKFLDFSFRYDEYGVQNDFPIHLNFTCRASVLGLVMFSKFAANLFVCWKKLSING
jgi:hypothetical protein